MPLDRFFVRLQDMDRADMRQIAEYIRNLQERLCEWDYRGLLTLSGAKTASRPGWP